MQKKNRAGFLGLSLIALLAGCGSSGSGVSQADIDRFVGDWKFDSENISGTCGAAGPSLQQDLTGQVMTLAQGTGAQIMLTLASTCHVTFTVVSASMATAVPAQSMCSLTVSGMTVMIAVTSWTLTTSDGMTMSTMQAGTALVGLCTVTGSGMATKQTGTATDAGAD
jgi:hypothetical protein